jgi:hypothetical protein
MFCRPVKIFHILFDFSAMVCDLQLVLPGAYNVARQTHTADIYLRLQPRKAIMFKEAERAQDEQPFDGVDNGSHELKLVSADGLRD